MHVHNFMLILPFFAFQDGLKPIQVAAAAGNKSAVSVLLPLTSKIQNVPSWSVEGLIQYMQSEAATEQVTWIFLQSGITLATSLDAYRMQQAMYILN